jgi:hypothetical protein
MSEEAQHGKHDKHAAHGRLVERLRSQGAEVERLTRGLDDDALSKPTVPDKWSLKELVCHLWRVQRLFEGRIEAMVARDNPMILPYSPDGDHEFELLVAHPATETRAAFLADRDNFAAWLDALSPAGWHRSGQHPEFAGFDVHFQVEFMAHHEAHHIYQLFERRVPLGKLPH